MPRRNRHRTGVRVVAVPGTVADVRLTCKDCEPGTKRPAPHPGPRCATHHRAHKAKAKRSAHDRRLKAVYGIDREFFDALLVAQDGACAICQRAKGISRQLSVDHDHNQAILDGHDEDKGCINCVRGLLCGTCNKMLGHLRDDPEAFGRAVTYLRYWPSKLSSVRTAAGGVSSGSLTPSASDAGE